MSAPSVTYTFANSTTADATQVNQNFTDIINGVSDGTKDFSINALTCAGTATLNGSVNLGNAAGDDLTITASLASTLPVKTNASFDIGSATLGLRSIYVGGTSSFTTRLLSAATATHSLTLPATQGAAITSLYNDGSGNLSWSKRKGNVTSTAVDLTLDSTHDTVLATAACVITLPTAVGLKGQRKLIVNASAAAANVTVNTTSSETIGARASGDIILRRQNNFLLVESDDAKWIIAAKHEHHVLTSSNGQALNGVSGSFQNNSPAVTLGIGVWELTGRFAWNYGASSTGSALTASTGFYGANGANTTSTPTTVAAGGNATVDGPTTFSDMASGYNLYPNQAATGNFSSPSMTTRIIVTSGTQTVYFVPCAGFTVAGTQSFIGYINARRIF